MTPFGHILKRAVEATPGAIGGSFADSQGEMVDSFTAPATPDIPRYDAHDWAVLTAHFGVLLVLVESALGTWHFGGPEYFIAQHAKLEIVVHTVDDGYFTLLATRRSHPECDSMTTLGRAREAALALKKEMA